MPHTISPLRRLDLKHQLAKKIIFSAESSPSSTRKGPKKKKKRTVQMSLLIIQGWLTKEKADTISDAAT